MIWVQCIRDTVYTLLSTTPALPGPAAVTAAFFFKRLRRWWHMRDPEIRWIAEVGVEEVPEEANPAPERLPPPHGFVARTIDENSYLLDDPDLLLTILRAAEERREERLRLHGLPGETRLIVSKPEVASGPHLVMLGGERFNAWLLVYYGVVVAARLDEVGMGSSYGLQALKWLDEWSGEVNVVIVRLRERLYRWGPEFSVYIRGIDNQHQYLVVTLNNLYRHLLAGSPRRVLDDTLDALAGYTRFHFRSEERLFDRYSYPRAQGHRRQHRIFVDKVEDFMEKYKANEQRLTLEVLHFLADWVRNHILTSDHDFGEWFLQHGVPIVDERLVAPAREARRRLGLD